MSQKNCLNEVKHMGLQVRTGVIFVAEKRLQRPFTRVAAAFAFFADQLNIAYGYRMVIR